MSEELHLAVEPGLFVVCRLPVDAPWPVGQPGFYSVTRTRDEISIICEEPFAPAEGTKESGWRMLRVVGILDLDLVGILSSIARPLAEAKVAIFAMSTHDTDYLLVKEKDLETATLALREAGHLVEG